MSEIPSDRTEARSALRELGTFNDPVDIRNYYRGNNTNLTKDDREQLDRIAELLPAEEIARKLDQPQLAETIEGSTPADRTSIPGNTGGGDPVSVEVTFKTLPGAQYNVRVGVPGDTVEYLTNPRGRNRGAIERALEVVNTAPSFDNFSATAIEQQLGDGIYAVVETPTQSVWATEQSYVPIMEINRQNPPFTAGDVLPSSNSPGGTWEVIDWPTGGPTFENASGMRVQLENDNVADELSPDSNSDSELPRVGFSSGFDDPQPAPGNGMDDQPQGSAFTDPDVLPVDSEMREMAVEFIENDLSGQVRPQKMQRAIEEFETMATTPGDEFDYDVRTLLEEAFDRAGVDIPRNRARRFNPEDQRAVGGATGTERMDVRWPRGIDPEQVSNVGALLSDEGYDRELYGPLVSEQFPTDPRLLRRLADIMEDFAETRASNNDDDGQGFYLRLAGLMYQAADQQR
jgi:hypothetical protein